MLMPRAQFEALERCWQARRDRGVDSDESTVDKDKDEDDPQEEAAPLETRIRKTTIDMFKQVLLFSQGAAESFYNDKPIEPAALWHMDSYVRTYVVRIMYDM